MTADTVRVDICYRPLRVAWAIASGDREAFRQAIRLSHTLWGGRFNPIVIVDRPEAEDLVELYRADMIVTLGDSLEVQKFAERFPHLMKPYFPDTLFLRDTKAPGRAHLLDVHNAVVYCHDKPGWGSLCEQGVRTFSWDPNDPLADVFLMQLGAYPASTDIGIDYLDIITRATLPHPRIDISLSSSAPIPVDILQHPGIPYISRLGLRRHYSVRPGWDYPGLFVGDSSSIDDLVCYWNLRAADISVQFIDPSQSLRYELVRPEYESRLRQGLSQLDEHHRELAVWADRARLEDAIALFPDGGISACGLDGHSWKGGAVRPPMMILGEASSLGVLGEDGGQPRVSFALSDKPFASENWFHTQHLVASLSFVSGLPRGGQHTFHPPYVPELNEFFARTMNFQHDRLRIEPERIGLVTDAVDHDAFLKALPVSELAERIFDLAGLKAKPSGAGLIARQLISRLGGVDGARVFKIPGVRRLIKTYGPTATFTKRAALQLIGGKDPARPAASFKDHEDLYIEPRPFGTKLDAPMVFAYLVDKSLFRLGAELICPSCRLASWTALDQLRQQLVCDLCGVAFDATRQLIDGEFHYRRTGVLGLEKNAQGAVPVALTLQQLAVNIDGFHHNAMYLPSIDVEPKEGVELPACEIDFLGIIPATSLDRAEVILGECKNEGGQIDAKDVENMRRIADAFPRKRFDVFIVFAKLAPFSDGEIALAKSLNGEYQQRVILLTDRELEPFHIYEHTRAETGIVTHGGSLGECARVTSAIYFNGTGPEQSE
ncbi:MAG: hypothetical protein P4L76_17550 [Beijerinckiaceae bacterium]|nr:hypothetical protein [Beijerinckiaceae bacterium]